MSQPPFVLQEKPMPMPALQELLELDDSDVPVAALRLISPLTADRKMSPVSGSPETVRIPFLS